MTMSMSDQVRRVFDADRRLTCLRILCEGGGRASSSTLEKSLRLFSFGRVDRASTNADVRWLAAAGLVETEELRPDLLAVTISARGERVARGEEFIEGVSRPSRD